MFIHFRADENIPQRRIKNVETVEISECHGIKYVDISYIPCGGCKDENCECLELAVYVPVDVVAMIEEVPREGRENS